MNNDATMFLYAEHFAGKGPNDVISCLHHYVSSLPPLIKKLHIFADNCFSQNKNKFIIANFNHVIDFITEKLRDLVSPIV